MTRATFAKSCGLDSRWDSEPTVRIWYGDMFIDFAVSSSPPWAYWVALVAISVDRMSWGAADGSMFQVPGAISPSSRRWSLPNALTALTAQSGTDSTDGAAVPAAFFRSSTDTQWRSPSRSTQVAREIRLKMPSVTALVLTSSTSSSWRPSGITSLPTRFRGSARRATALDAAI